MKRTMVRLVLVAILLIVLISGCDLFGDKVSISDRIKQFESDINNSLSSVGGNLHPSVPGRDQFQGSAFWQVHFPIDDRAYSVVVSGTSNTRTGNVVATTGVGTRPLSLRFREDGSDNWKIDRIVLAGTQIVPTP